jgi:hypothetical protein
VLMLFSSCVHHLLECPGFICLGFTWYLLVDVLMLPIPQHGLLKDPPSFVAICTPQGLAVKATCMQDCCRRISPACIGQELMPFQLSTVYVCTTWRLDPKALAILPGFCIAVGLSASSTCLHTYVHTHCHVKFLHTHVHCVSYTFPVITLPH